MRAESERCVLLYKSPLWVTCLRARLYVDGVCVCLVRMVVYYYIGTLLYRNTIISEPLVCDAYLCLLQCVEVCCSVLQCVAVCGSVLQCVAVHILL